MVVEDSGQRCSNVHMCRPPDAGTAVGLTQRRRRALQNKNPNHDRKNAAHEFFAHGTPIYRVAMRRTAPPRDNVKSRNVP